MITCIDAELKEQIGYMAFLQLAEIQLDVFLYSGVFELIVSNKQIISLKSIGCIYDI